LIKRFKQQRQAQKGQSVIEYVLLLAVVMFLVATIFRSQLFTDLFGQDSSFFAALKERMEYGYRYTHGGLEAGSGRVDQSADAHPSYRESGGSRFAGATSPYGP
jgi:hypothetical protein